jgi:hypothetical protein
METQMKRWPWVWFYAHGAKGQEGTFSSSSIPCATYQGCLCGVRLEILSQLKMIRGWKKRAQRG